ncbi:MAG: hypothetical protein JWO19_4574 [Bryobacterales bacterium]|jgi:hypothetical protein|nr:hypothetical protein [Bryobacterales bacterium]
MPCEQWSRCVVNYQRAVQTYGEAVFSLSYGTGAELNHSWQLAERARKNSEAARTAILDHEHDHACTLAQPYSGDGQMPGVAAEELVLGDQGQSGG